MAHPFNVIYIITDQQRWEHLGCNGHPHVQTPNIDLLASQGLTFDRFYCNNPICTPSRAAILTGRTPRSNRVWDNGCPLPDDETTLPEVLAAQGFRTQAFGKLHLTPWWDESGVYYESGSYWRDHKRDDLPEPYMGFQASEICIGHVTHDTGHYGKWLEAHYPQVHANWQEYLQKHPSGARDTFLWAMPPEAHANSWIADRACSFLQQQSGDKPFFLHVGFPDPHHAFRAPEPWGSMYKAEDMELRAPHLEPLETKPPEYLDFMRGHLNEDVLGAGDFNTLDMTDHTDDQYRQIIATTLGMVSFIDAQVGRILDTLEANGQAEDTLVVFTTDHGDLMGDHRLFCKGPFLLEGLVRVPFVIAGPGVNYASGRCAALCEHIDFYPTLLDLLGLDCPRGVEGRSFASLLAGKTTVHRDRVLVEFLHQFQLDRNVKALIKDKWKIIYWGGQDYGELYNLQDDPLEADNRWHDPACSQMRARLIHELLDELMQTENILPFPPAIA